MAQASIASWTTRCPRWWHSGCSSSCVLSKCWLQLLQRMACFTQELVTKVGTQLAGSISDRYLAESPRHELVVLEDVHGWVPTWRDVVNAKGCLVPILQHEATRVPGLMFIMMVILVADSVLNSKVVKGSETEAYKYPRTHHPLCGFPRAPSLASRELSNKAF